MLEASKTNDFRGFSFYGLLEEDSQLRKTIENLFSENCCDPHCFV